MIIVVQILFWLCVFALFHSYVLYPLLLQILTSGKKGNQQVYTRDDELPNVYILMAAYNEEAVIEEKIQSVLKSDYPIDKVIFAIGSDGSTDATDGLIEKYKASNENLYFQRFEGRLGKANILNELHKHFSKNIKPNDVIILTDANVFFEPKTVFELVKHFKNERIGQVGANVLNKGLRKDGISYQEQFYIQRENRIKYMEGLNSGTMIGAFGACYAIKASSYLQLPSKFLMEDFYMSMKILQSKKQAILEKEAVCFEDVSNDIKEEYKRKKRISAGNYQNLFEFIGMLNPFSRVGFSFLSHKVLRWLGPFFILGAFICSVCLALWNPFYLILLILQIVLFTMPLIDRLMRKVNVQSVILRFITYFFNMNLALMAGFFMYVKGIKSNAWQPTKRNV